MGLNHSPRIITNALVLCLDAANRKNAPIVPVEVEYLVVAGGGGGARFSGGGGGGGVLTGTTIVTSGTYTVTVGLGGTGGSSAVDSTPTWGGTGGNSVFGSITAFGGGGGASRQSGGAGLAGNPGGSGGGASPADNSVKTGGAASPSGQGNKGGDKLTTGWGGGGGGGAGAAGANSSGNVGGNGGIGILSSISGTATYYAGGGGGSSYNNNTAGTGGLGGGGNGKSDNVSAGNNGTVNTGGGGGGGAYPSGNGGNGGSGIVIIRYAGPQRATGGTVTTVGSNTVHTFTTSGEFTLNSIQTDLSGLGNNGTSIGGVGYNSANEGSLVFDGTNAYNENSSPNLGISGNASITMSCWFYDQRTLTSTFQALFAYGNGPSAGDTFAIGLLNLGVRMEFNGGNATISSNNVYSLNTWNNVVVTKTPGAANTTTKLYLNGVELSIASSTTITPSVSSRVIRVGRWTNDGSPSYFQGRVSNCLIYNRALTASEIQQNFNALRGRFGI